METKRRRPASESLLSETLELLGEPLWPFPGLDDELLPSLKNEGQSEVGATGAGKTERRCKNQESPVEISPSLLEKSQSDHTERGIKRFGVILHQLAQEPRFILQLSNILHKFK